jgi:hypothetical protein
MLMGPRFFSPNLEYRFFIHMASFVVSTRERYSDSVDDRAT